MVIECNAAQGRKQRPAYRKDRGTPSNAIERCLWPARNWTLLPPADSQAMPTKTGQARVGQIIRGLMFRQRRTSRRNFHYVEPVKNKGW